MCGWEEGAQNGIWREAGVWVRGGSAKWDEEGGRICGREEGAQNGIWREAGHWWVQGGSTTWYLAGGRMCGWEEGAHKGGGGRLGAGMGKGKNNMIEWEAECVVVLGLEMEGRWKVAST